MNFKITECNILFDNQVIEDLIKYKVYNNKKESKLFGDKGYICKEERQKKKKKKKNKKKEIKEKK